MEAISTSGESAIQRVQAKSLDFAQILTPIFILFLASLIAVFFMLFASNLKERESLVKEQTALFTQGLANALNITLLKPQTAQNALEKALHDILPTNRKYGEFQVFTVENSKITAEIGSLVNLKNDAAHSTIMTLAKDERHYNIQQNDVEALKIDGVSYEFAALMLKGAGKKLIVLNAAPKINYSLYLGVLFTGMLGFSLLFLVAKSSLNAYKTADTKALKRNSNINEALLASNAGLWTWHKQTRTLSASHSLITLLGLPTKTQFLTAEMLKEIIHADDFKRFISLLEDPYSQIDLMFRALHQNGTYLWLRAKSNRQHPHKINGLVLDVTEQRDLSERLTVSDGRLRQAIDLLPSGLVIWDKDDRLVLMNTSFKNSHTYDDGDIYEGMKRQELLTKGNNFLASLTLPYSDENSVVEEIKSENEWHHIVTKRTIDGGLASVITNITKLKTHELDLLQNEYELTHQVYLLEQARDSLEAQRQEISRKNELLVVERENAIKANESKSNFLANMSHDLRTPLNAINGFSETMCLQVFGELNAPSYRTYPENILKAGKQLLDLVDEILDVAKLEKGKMEITKETITLTEILDETLDLFSKQMEYKNQALILDIEPNIIFEADKHAMKKVLLNLFSNAIKFTQDGGKITLYAQKEQDGVHFAVKDNGIGIKAEDLPRLCQPFEKCEMANIRNYNGSGLGLFISKSLVSLHGGSFNIKSVEGEGTEVGFIIPHL